MPHYRKAVDVGFFDKWSPAMAYVLGYFAADGAMYVNRHGARHVGFTSTDRILLEHVKTLLRAEHRIMRKHRGTGLPRWKPVRQLQIGGGELFKALERLGFTPNKDCSMRFPEIPESCLADFVRGYFDRDGCIGFGWYRKGERRSPSLWIQLCFASGSLPFLADLDQALQRMVGVGQGYLRQRPCGCYLYYQRRQDIRHLCAFLYSGGLPTERFLARKRQRFEEALRALGA